MRLEFLIDTDGAVIGAGLPEWLPLDADPLRAPWQGAIVLVGPVDGVIAAGHVERGAVVSFEASDGTTQRAILQMGLAEPLDAVALAAIAGPLAIVAPPPPSVAQVRKECQRRMIALVGARDSGDLDVKISNAQREAARLHSIRIGIPGVVAAREWTAEEAQRAAALWGADAAIELLRARSNALEAASPIPHDYAADSYWS